MDGGGADRVRFTYHGGDLAAARAAFPDAPMPWIDLSTGINPVPYPVPDLPSAVWSRLPSPADAARLEAVAARAYGAHAADVVAAPGTQALIGWLPRLAPARRVAVLGPSYAEHARVWRAAGAAVDTVADTDALAGADVAVVVNPNNPDGRLLAPAALERIARTVGLLVVDEAFADVMPEGSSLVPGLPGNAVVLRSFGKAYGLAGLRLGFAVGPVYADAFRRALGPWAVSGPALAVASQALADRAWLAAATARLRRDAARLDALLGEAGAAVVGGTPLFRLVAVEDGPGWFERLARAGILVRPFAERSTLLRFGLPAADRAWERLAAVLRDRAGRR